MKVVLLVLIFCRGQVDADKTHEVEEMKLKKSDQEDGSLTICNDFKGEWKIICDEIDKFPTGKHELQVKLRNLMNSCVINSKPSIENINKTINITQRSIKLSEDLQEQLKQEISKEKPGLLNLQVHFSEIQNITSDYKTKNSETDLLIEDKVKSSETRIVQVNSKPFLTDMKNATFLITMAMVSMLEIPVGNLFDQNFGLGLLNDDLYQPLFGRSGYYRPWRHFTRKQSGTSNVTNDKDKFQVNLDVQDYKPEEITVKTVNNTVTIEGKHEGKQDKYGYISRHFVRRYVLSQQYPLEHTSVDISSNGTLTVSVSKKA